MSGAIWAFVLLLLIDAGGVWLLWRAIATGKVAAPYSALIERAKKPVSFWINITFHMILFAPLLIALFVAGWSIITGTKIPGVQ